MLSISPWKTKNRGQLSRTGEVPSYSLKPTRLRRAAYLVRYASVVTWLEIVRQCVESACALSVLRALAVVVSVEAFRQPERHRRGLYRLSGQYLVRLPRAQ